MRVFTLFFKEQFEIIVKEREYDNKNIYNEGELSEESTIRKNRIVQKMTPTLMSG